MYIKLPRCQTRMTSSQPPVPKYLKRLQSEALIRVAHAHHLELASTDRMQSIMSPIEIVLGDTVKSTEVKKKSQYQNTRLAIQKTRIQKEKLGKQMRVLEVQMSMEANRFLIAGFNKGVPLTSIATHVTNHPTLTMVGIKRRQNKEYGFDPALVGHETLQYGLASGVLDNLLQNGNLYFPRPMGGEFRFEDISENGKHIFYPVRNGQIDPQFNGSPDFPYDLRYRSVLFPLDKPKSETPLMNFIASQLQGYDSHSEHATQICESIKTLTIRREKGFSYDYPLKRSFYTADYETFLCQVRCEKVFEFDDLECKIEVHRKYVASVLNISKADHENHLPYLIPQCEEAIVYIQIRSDCVYKNTPKCFVLSSTPILTSNICSHLHVFGDNAYTLLLPSNLYKVSDRHEASMKTVGAVIREHENIKTMPVNPNQRNEVIARYRGLLRDPDPKHMTNPGISSLIDTHISNQRQKYIDNADSKDEREKFAEHFQKIGINDDTRPSSSFLCNQACKSLITTDALKTPIMHHWVSGATFSFIALSPSVVSDHPKTYGFVQTFALRNKHNTSDIQPVLMNTDDFSDSSSVGAPEELRRRTFPGAFTPSPRLLGVEKFLTSHPHLAKKGGVTVIHTRQWKHQSICVKMEEV